MEQTTQPMITKHQNETGLMTLTGEQKEAFRRDGVLPLRQIVPQELVQSAQRAINAYIGEYGIDPAKLNHYRSRSYCDDLSNTSAIKDLLSQSPLFGVAEQLIGQGQVDESGWGQVALRFPRPLPPEGEADTPSSPHPHLDGMYSPHNGVQEGTIANFTALVGVLLSDVPEQNSGNFTYWPGTHLQYEEYFRLHTPQSLLNGLPPIQMPEPVQFTGKAGDAVLVHYQIAHGIAANLSPNTRYAIFFRLTHKNHDQYKWECMTDVWKEWKGIER